MRTFSRFLAFVVLMVGLPLLAAADGGDDLDRQRKTLEKWKSDPQHYARLRQDLQAFLALPEERQKEIRKLDHDLHDEISTTQARLQRVLERYTDWLQRLPEADRKKIESTKNNKDRLRLIKETREREWISRLPRAQQEELAKLQADPARYQQRLQELRQQERKRNGEWAVAMKHWGELQQKGQEQERQKKQQQHLAEIQKHAAKIKEFVTDSLMPLLSDAEKQRLTTSFEAAARDKGQWVMYFTTLVELADRHRIEYPPSPEHIGPKRFTDLPAQLQTRLKKAPDWPPPQVEVAEGKWPDYALAVTMFARKNKIGLGGKQLGPSNLDQFSKSVRDFCREELFPVLSEAERDNLRNTAQGIWPRYPNQLLNLARKHQLQMPGMALPGQRYLWQPFRQRVQSNANAEPLPDVTDQMLRDFVQKDLSPVERADLPSFSLSDPASRELIKQEYFSRNPDVLQRLQKADQKKRTGKGTKK